MDLGQYTTETRNGVGLRLATAMGVSPVLVSQWATGKRPIPANRAAPIEFLTDFAVPAETSCPWIVWVRVKHPDWPNGKPLIDTTKIPPPRPAKPRRLKAAPPPPMPRAAKPRGLKAAPPRTTKPRRSKSVA